MLTQNFYIESRPIYWNELIRREIKRIFKAYFSGAHLQHSTSVGYGIS